MANLFDYLNWRGDLSFEQSPFHIVDSLILTRFSYLPFDDIVTEQPITLEKACAIFFDQEYQTRPDVVLEEDITLLEQMASANRYKNLVLQCYDNVVDEASQMQFSAMLIQLDAKTSYVAFRGTDLNLVGWKEDFNMAFEKTVPGQLRAGDYLNSLAPFLRDKVILGGHSKGGNFAIFAAVSCASEIKEKILYVDNFDGPSFHADIVFSEQYQQMKHKLFTYVPEMTIIGTIFEHDHTITFVKSNSKSFEQHDTYTWKVTATDLVTVDSQTESQNPVQSVLFTLLDQLNVEQRRQVINTIYHILESANLKTLKDIRPFDITGMMKMLKTYANLTKNDASLLHNTISLAVKSALKKDKNTPA